MELKGRLNGVKQNVTGEGSYNTDLVGVYQPRQTHWPSTGYQKYMRIVNKATGDYFAKFVDYLPESSLIYSLPSFKFNLPSYSRKSTPKEYPEPRLSSFLSLTGTTY